MMMANSPRGFVETKLTNSSMGFTAPAEDFAESALDLNRYVIKHPSSTFYMQVAGNAHQALNIFDGDVLVVDRALLPSKSKTIIIISSGELRLLKLNQGDTLDCQTEYWGTVTHIIRKLK